MSRDAQLILDAIREMESRVGDHLEHYGLESSEPLTVLSLLGDSIEEKLREQKEKAARLPQYNARLREVKISLAKLKSRIEEEYDGPTVDALMSRQTDLLSQKASLERRIADASAAAS